MLPSGATTNAKDYYTQRALEILPGFLTWGTIFGVVTLSLFAPLYAAIAVILYDLYWLIKVIYLSIYTVMGYINILRWQKIDWAKRLEKFKKAEDIYHLIILPTFKEGEDILIPTLESLIKSTYPKDKMIVILALEERVGKKAAERTKDLEKKYKNKFFLYKTIIHPDGIAGEAKVKGANMAWTAKQIAKLLPQIGIKNEQVIVSAFDCDTRPHPQYFSALTWAFCISDKPHNSSYQPVMFYHNNIWESNAIIRFMMANSSFWNMIETQRPERIVTFSSHSMSFKTLVDVGYWPVNMISDDSIIFWKCYFYFHGDYKVEPIYLPLSMDAVWAPTFFETIKNQYKQFRRWAWGAENVPLVIRGFMAEKNIPFYEKFIRIFKEVEGRWSWATAPIIITGLGWLPQILGGEDFKSSIISFKFPLLLSNLMTISMIGLVIGMMIGLVMVPPLPKGYSRLRYLSVIFQWALAPLLSIPMVALPAIDAQTRLMLGKYMEFWVTPKGKSNRGKK